MMDRSKHSVDQATQFPELKVLNYASIRRIDDLLQEIGSFGELRLIKRKGALRFIEKIESIDLYQDASPLSSTHSE